jgi:sec-independent protein translocase protein TatB
MFDMGFTELMLIGIVALVVIGPERLPGVARTAGKYVGRLKRFMTTVKADVEQELRADELRQILSDQQSELDSLKDSITEAGRGVEQEFGLKDVISTEAAAPEMTAAAPDVIQETPLPDPVSEKGVAKAAAKKPAARDSASKKAASKKAAVKKPAVKKDAAKKPATSNSSIKKATAKKVTAKKATAKKATAKKATPKKATSDSAT